MLKFKFIFYFLLSIFLFACTKKSEGNTSIFGKWKVDSYLANGSSTQQNAQDTITLTFSNDKSLGIRLEINNCGTSFSIEKNTLSIDSLIACTEACCDSEFSMTLLEILPKVTSYNFIKEDLNLSGENDLNIRCKPIE